MKSDEIYRQKPIDKQNYGFSQKLIHIHRTRLPLLKVKRNNEGLRTIRA